MRYRKILLCLGLALLVVAGAGAQDNRFRIGLGVGISRELPFYYWGSEFPGFFMPLDFSNFTLVLRTNNIRVEPNFGYFAYGESESGDYGYSNNTSNLRFGALVAFATSNGSMNFYYGANFGISLILSTSVSNYPGAESESMDDPLGSLFVGPAIGGEYMFDDNFSFGGEIQVNYIAPEFLTAIDGDVSQYMISSRLMILLRWYLL